MINKPAWPISTNAQAHRVSFAEGVGLAALLIMSAGSAVVTKQLAARHNAPALAALAGSAGEGDDWSPDAAGLDPLSVSDPLENPATHPAGLVAADELVAEAAPAVPPAADTVDARFEADLAVRWFNGRPVRPVRTMWMTVTAYSPDERSCGDSADGITASLHRVETNAHRLVAADTRILPLGAKVSIPGYDQGQIVPVLDRGGLIKGHRLDVLFPTHERARQWGVKRLPVVVWDYADGAGAENWRRIRDSKR